MPDFTFVQAPCGECRLSLFGSGKPSAAGQTLTLPEKNPALGFSFFMLLKYNISDIFCNKEMRFHYMFVIFFTETLPP